MSHRVEILLTVLGMLAATAVIGILFGHLAVYIAAIVFCVVLAVREGRKPPDSGEDDYE